MPKLIAEGGYPIDGVCRIGGAKNAVLPILAACMLTRRSVRLLDCPRLTDVENMLGILRLLGCGVERAAGIAGEGETLSIDASSACRSELPEELSKELRSSIFLLGPVLGRFRHAVVTYPGGCEIGNRPIDLHLSGLSALNADIREGAGASVATERASSGRPSTSITRRSARRKTSSWRPRLRRGKRASTTPRASRKSWICKTS